MDADVTVCEQYVRMLISLRDQSGLFSLEDVPKLAESDVDNQPLGATIVALACYCGYGVNRDISLAKSMAKNCVPWLRNICESPFRKNNPLFPIVAYPFSLCIRYKLDEEEDFDKYFLLLLEAMSVKAYPFLFNSVADAYKNGVGTPVNVFEAAKLFRQAADGGLGFAYFNLAECYRTGSGVVEDASLAFTLYNQAITVGYKKALVHAGECCFFDLGVEQSYAAAVTYYQQAADCGLDHGQFKLAYCYENGLGIDRNLTMARHWSKIAFSKGHLDSGLLYATLLLFSDTHFDSFDPSQALETLTQLVESDEEATSSKAAYFLGLYYHGEINGAAVDKAKALKWFMLSFQSPLYRIENFTESDRSLIKAVFATACEINDQLMMRWIIDHKYFDPLLVLEGFEISSVSMKHAIPALVEFGQSVGRINCQLAALFIIDYDMPNNEMCTFKKKSYVPNISLNDRCEELTKEFHLRLEYGLDIEMFTIPFQRMPAEQEQWGDVEWAMFEILEDRGKYL